jgi:hypothetical protein
MNEEIVHEFAVMNGYPQIRKAKNWRGYEVYEPVFFEDVYIGLPLIILVKGDSIRLSSVDEAFAYLEEQPDE